MRERRDIRHVFLVIRDVVNENGNDAWVQIKFHINKDLIMMYHVIGVYFPPFFLRPFLGPPALSHSALLSPPLRLMNSVAKLFTWGVEPR